MMIKYPFFAMALAFTTVACSSAPKNPTASELEPDRVVARIDDRSSRPDWVKESEPFRIKDGMVTSLGQTTIPGDNRVEAAYRIAENNAKGAIANAIEVRLETIFQNAEEGTSLDATQARYIGAEASNLTTSSLRISDRYWEKVATTQDTGQRLTQYRVFADVTMPEADFKRAVLDAIARAHGKVGLSENFAKKVDAQWDRFTSEQTGAVAGK
jgi:hypothetical protein